MRPRSLNLFYHCTWGKFTNAKRPSKCGIIGQDLVIKVNSKDATFDAGRLFQLSTFADASVSRTEKNLRALFWFRKSLNLTFFFTHRMTLSGIVLIIGILLGITTLVGILGNISVCLVVFWNRSMRSQLHLLLVNLAIADVGMSASCMPFAVATVLFHEKVCAHTTSPFYSQESISSPEPVCFRSAEIKSSGLLDADQKNTASGDEIIPRLFKNKLQAKCQISSCKMW